MAGIKSPLDSHGSVLVNTPRILSQAGYSVQVCENDAGSVTGTPYIMASKVSPDRKQSVGIDTPLFDYNFNAAAQNTGVWRHVFDTMTMTQSSGFLNCNANSNNVASKGCQLTTWKTFPLFGNGALEWEMTGEITSAPLAGEIFEAGLFPLGSGVVAPTEGVYFRLTSAGLIGVINFNGTETPTAVLMSAGSFPVNANGQYKLVIGERNVEFWVNDIYLGAIACPSGNGQPFLSGAQPISIQYRNSGTVTGTSMIVKVSDCHLDQKDINFAKEFAAILSGMGRHGSQGQDGGVMGSTAISVNAAPAAAAALVATTAAAQFTGLGGEFLVLPTLAAGTNGILCSYLNPVGGVNQTPRTLYIYGVSVGGAVAVVLTGGALALAYTLAYGHTAVSPATAESASFTSSTAKAPRRLAIGMQSCIAAAVAGVNLGDINRSFRAPICVNPGEYVQILVRNQGVVTTLGSIALTVSFDTAWV